MKVLFMLLPLLITSVFAVSEEEARALHAKRGESAENARLAYEMFNEVLASRTDLSELKKAQLTIASSRSLYFVAISSEDRDEKLELHTKGQEIALKAAEFLASEPGVAKKEEYKSDLAYAYYFFGAHLGQWGQAKGVLASLRKWPKLKKHTRYILDLDETIEDYGAHRILGRAYMRVPGESKSESQKLLAEAYEKTLIEVDGVESSRNALGAIYYLAILKKRDEVARFCEVFDSVLFFAELDEEFQSQINPKLDAEVKMDLNDFLNKTNKEMEELHEFSDENC